MSQQQRVPAAEDTDGNSDEALLDRGRRASGLTSQALVDDYDNDDDDDGHRDSSDSDQPLRTRRSGRPLPARESDSDQPLRARRQPRLSRHGAGQDDVASQLARRADTRRTGNPAVSEDEGVVTRRITQSTRVDEDFSFRVDVILPGRSVRLEPDFENLRVCSLVSGRVVIKVQGEQVFEMGFGGVIKLVPGLRADVLNAAGMEAVLHTSCSRQRE